MTTRSIVPRYDDEGGIGVRLKRWGTGFINSLTAKQIIGEDGAGSYLKLPHLTSAERNALAAQSGMLIFNTTTDQAEKYEGGIWAAVGGGGGGTDNHAALTHLDYATANHTGFAPTASPALTGTPTAPTATLGTNTTQIATTAFVQENKGGGGTTDHAELSHLDYATAGHTGFQAALSNPVTGPGTGCTVGHFAMMGNVEGTQIVDGGVLNLVSSELQVTSGRIVEYKTTNEPSIRDSGITTSLIHTTTQQKATSVPLVDGIATIGDSERWSPANHVHPTDTSLQPLLTNPVTGPGSGCTVGHLALVGNVAGTSIIDGGEIPSGTTFEDNIVNIRMNGSQSLGTTSKIPRSDHVHPTDTSRAPVSGIRERLAMSRVYYVRTDGNDANNGLTNTAGGAWATIDHSVSEVCTKLDFNGNIVTIQLGIAGTYSGGVFFATSWVGGGGLEISGATGVAPTKGDIETYSVTNTGGPWFQNTTSCQDRINISGVAISSSSYGIYLRNPISLYLNNIVWKACPSGHLYASEFGTYVNLGSSNYYVTGNAAAHWISNKSSTINAANVIYSISSAISITTWATITNGGSIQWTGAIFTGSANVTGRKFILLTGGIAQSGATYPTGGVILPGTLAGTGTQVPFDGFWGV